jgi:glycosyltransferase involved in cell wall biosynthesis
MRYCDQVICVCRAQDRHWQANYPFLHGRTTVIYNGVDTEWFDPEKVPGMRGWLRKEHRIPEDAFVACAIAAFRPEKGHRYLIQAFKQVVSAYPNAYLLLAGDGPLREEMETTAKETGLSEKVLFLGVIHDVRPLLAASDISIIASTAVETFSMAMLESLAMGVPMVMTDIGGAREAIYPGNTGVLVQAGDTQALANGILELAKDTARREMMGTHARRFVCDAFTRERMIRETAQVLRNEVPDEGEAICHENAA